MNRHEHNISILLHLLYYAPELEDLWAGSRLSATFNRRLEEAIRFAELEPKAEQELDRQVEDLLKVLLESDRSQRLTAILEEARDGGGALPVRVSWMAWSASTGVPAKDRLKRLNELRMRGAIEAAAAEELRGRGRSVTTRGEDHRNAGFRPLPLDFPLSGLTDSPVEIPEPTERSINIWLAEARDREGGTLSPGRTSVLHFSVGVAVGGSLVAGQDVEVKDSDVPDEGLETRWFLCSSTLDFAAAPGDVATTVSVGAGNVHQAVFSLRIPKQAETEVRRLRISPRLGKEVASLDVTIFVGTEIYRQLTVRFGIEGNAAALATRDEIVHTPLRHASLRTLHEWTTPPGTLAITVLGDRAAVRGDLGGSGQVEQVVEWFGADGQIAGRINSLRAHAEKFRIKHEAYLNAVGPADLMGRLGSFHPQYDWQALSFEADAAHEAAWDVVARSAELHNLAVFGHLLYKAFFPDGGEFRRWIDSLGPGHRLDISWLRGGGPGWLPHVPWGLMYREPPPPMGAAIDPMNFLGLRFRIAHSSHAQQGTKALGVPAEVPQAHLLYWGDDAPTGAESRWQRALWQNVGRPMLLPAGTEAAPKAELLTVLDPPPGKGSPLSLLYLFCNCTVGDGSDPALRFGDTNQASAVINLSEFGLSPLLGQPLVFANACSTAAADPYFASELATTFIERGCRAFIGTEAKVPIELASRFAATFSRFFLRQVDPEPIAAGEAMAQARLFLWTQYRNLGGLFYTYVNRFELFMASDAEVAALRN